MATIVVCDVVKTQSQLPLPFLKVKVTIRVRTSPPTASASLLDANRFVSVLPDECRTKVWSTRHYVPTTLLLGTIAKALAIPKNILPATNISYKNIRMVIDVLMIETTFYRHVFHLATTPTLCPLVSYRTPPATLILASRLVAIAQMKAWSSQTAPKHAVIRNPPGTTTGSIFRTILASVSQ